MKQWIEQAQILKNIAQDSDLFAKKVTAKEIFGSNLLLTQKNVVVNALKTQWTAVKAAHTLVGKMPLSCVMAPPVGRV